MRKKIGVFGVFWFLMLAGVSVASPVPDTGQTICYNANGKIIPCPSAGQKFYGQDGNYSINPMSFSKLDSTGKELSDSALSWTMVRDNVTGLIWEAKTAGNSVANYNDPHDADNQYTWYTPGESNPGTPGEGTDTADFIKALNDAKFGGYSDWRMPTIEELAYLYDRSIPSPGPAVNTTFFPHTVSGFYWSDTTYASYEEDAWGVGFEGWASLGNHSKSQYAFVRAVRGGKTPSTFVNNGDGTITDTATGLMWQQTTPENTMTWEEALAYCESLSLGGHKDWRLPSINELISLADFSQHAPSIHTTFFPDTDPSFYWSSTTDADILASSLGVDFNTGTTASHDKYYTPYIRAVRGGLADPTQPIQVGKEPGVVQTAVSGNQVLELMINSTNTHGDIPVYEWLPFTATYSGSAIPVYLISDIGVVMLNDVIQDMASYTFTFDSDGLTSIATVSMSDLGLTSGDSFIYGYAYQNMSGSMIFDNMVFITVQ